MEKEKKNTGLIIILIILVLGLSGYIVYDNFFNKTDNKELKEENSVYPRDVDSKIDFVKFGNDLKDIFELLYAVYASPNAYCGNDSQISNETSPNGGNYRVSTQFKSYAELYSYLENYATKEVLATIGKISQNFYMEKEGNLYCADLGKGGAYIFDNTILEYKKMNDDLIETNIYKIMHVDEIKEIEIFDVSFTRNGDKWIISKFELIK